MNKINKQSGEMNSLTIPFVIMIVLVIGLGTFSVWTYLQYTDSKSDLDGKISVAVKEAKKEQTAEDAKSFIEKEKTPYRTFSGPADIGSIKFDFPKTWSVYLAQDGTNSSDYLVEFNPDQVVGDDKSVPGVSLTVDDDSYDKVILGYKSTIASGKVTATPITINGVTGLRLDGTISSNKNDPVGSLVILKVRDKTLILKLGVPDRLKDFNEIILATLSFNP